MWQRNIKNSSIIECQITLDLFKLRKTELRFFWWTARFAVIFDFHKNLAALRKMWCWATFSLKYLFDWFLLHVSFKVSTEIQIREHQEWRLVWHISRLIILRKSFREPKIVKNMIIYISWSFISRSWNNEINWSLWIQLKSLNEKNCL